MNHEQMHLEIILEHQGEIRIVKSELKYFFYGQIWPSINASNMRGWFSASVPMEQSGR